MGDLVTSYSGGFFRTFRLPGSYFSYKEIVTGLDKTLVLDVCVGLGKREQLLLIDFSSWISYTANYSQPFTFMDSTSTDPTNCSLKT